MHDKEDTCTMRQPYISVILPIYNVEKYIDEAFNSLLNQTIGFTNLEIILVNDCSKDGTLAILERYERDYENVKLMTLPKNSGAPGTPRNVGMQHTTGKYTIFLDPDDYIPFDAYEKLYRVAEEWESDFVMGRMISFNDSNPTGHQWFHITFRDYLMKKSYFNVNIDEVPFFLQVKTAVYLKLVRTDFMKENQLKFVEGMKNGEDKYYDMQLFTLAKKFSYIPETIYLYRTRDDETNPSMTQQDMEPTMLNDCKAAMLVKSLLTAEQYQTFQINALRSLFWKLINPGFNSLPYEKKVFLLEKMTPVIEGYNPNIIQKYYKFEYPVVSLISKREYDLAIEYIKLQISRKTWYLEGKQLLEIKNTQDKMLSSISWKLTKPLRKLNNLRQIMR